MHLSDLLNNHLIINSLAAWAAAQILKTIIYAFAHRKLDLERLFGDGGMPSGHSATVTSLATFSGLYRGFGSFEFAVCGILAIVVCHDAMGVRLETQKQGRLLQELVEAFEALHDKDLPEVKLKRFVGHTPLQVITGMILGIVNALVMYHFVFH